MAYLPQKSTISATGLFRITFVVLFQIIKAIHVILENLGGNLNQNKSQL